MPTEASCHIDQEWYQQGGRSLPVFVRSRLCPSCQQQLGPENGLDDLYRALGDCCSEKEGFLSFRLPLKERCFRLFLANGNQPLTLRQMSEKLGQPEEMGSFGVPDSALQRVIEADQFYGLRLLPASVPDLEKGVTPAER